MNCRPRSESVYVWPDDAESKLFERVARYMEGVGIAMRDRSEGVVFTELGRYLADTAAKGQPFEVSYAGLDRIIDGFQDVAATWRDASARVGQQMLNEMAYVQIVHASPVPDTVPDDMERLYG